MSTNQISGSVPLRGFFTIQKCLHGRSLQDIERILGLDSGRLAQGAWFATPIQLVHPGDFEFAGYSQVAGHHTISQYGNINSPANKYEMDAHKRIKESLIKEWQTLGENRLIKVIPMTGHSLSMSNDYQYPPGSGIPQWKFINYISCRGICFVNDYPNGKFNL